MSWPRSGFPSFLMTNDFKSFHKSWDMSTSSSEAVGGFAASQANRAIRDDPYYQKEIDSLSDLIQVGKTGKRRSPMEINEQVFELCKSIILEFDRWVEETQEEIEDLEMEELVDDFEESRSELREQYEEVEHSLTKVNDSVIDDMNSPSTYYSLKKFFEISKLYFQRIMEIDPDELKEIEDDRISRIVEDEPFFVKMGILVSFQPYMVRAVLVADKRNDTEFLAEYESTVNEMTRELMGRKEEIYQEFIQQ